MAKRGHNGFYGSYPRPLRKPRFRYSLVTIQVTVFVFVTRVAQNVALRNRKISPTRISLGVLSIYTYTRLVHSVLQRYLWSSIYIVLDISMPNPVLPSMMDAFVAALRGSPEMQVTAAYRNLTAEGKLGQVLTEFQSSSRGKKCFARWYILRIFVFVAVFIFLGTAGALRKLLVCKTSGCCIC